MVRVPKTRPARPASVMRPACVEQRFEFLEAVPHQPD